MYRDGRTRGDVRLLAVMLGLILVAKKDRDFVIAQSMPSLAQVPLWRAGSVLFEQLDDRWKSNHFHKTPRATSGNWLSMCKRLGRFVVCRSPYLSRQIGGY